MPDVIAAGTVKVSFVPTIANPSAPTVAQINAGQALDGFFAKNGLSLDPTVDAVDTTSLNSRFSTALPGRRGVSGELTLKDQGRGAPPWSTFAGKPSGFLVVRRLVDAANAWSTGDKLEVYPVQAGSRRPLPPAANDMSKFAVKMFFTGDPVDATVA